MMRDPDLFALLDREQERQEATLMMIPSENYASPAVLAAAGSVLANKYAEGYPGRRYYEGNEIIDEVERLAQARARELFHVPHVNVQPYSGSPANEAIQMALLKPGDTFLGLKLASGGHLTHGHGVTFGGTFFHPVQFGLQDDARINMDEVRRLAHEVCPTMILIGNTAYPFTLDFAAFGQIANEVGAWLVADISHIAGLVVAGEHPSPVPHAHVVMTTTHKTLRGPRGAMILVTEAGLARDATLAERIDKAVFPGLQGGPHNQTTAAMAQAFAEALEPSFSVYARQIRLNARALARRLQGHGLTLVGGGTDTHLLLLDLRSWGGGTQMAFALAQAGIYANKNTVPNEPLSPFYPSGVRLGTPALTTRGMGESEMEQIADWMAQVHTLAQRYVLTPTMSKVERREVIRAAQAWARGDERLAAIRREVAQLCARFPVYAAGGCWT